MAVFASLWEDTLALLIIAALGLVLYAKYRGVSVIVVLKELNELSKGGRRGS